MIAIALALIGNDRNHSTEGERKRESVRDVREIETRNRLHPSTLRTIVRCVQDQKRRQ